MTFSDILKSLSLIRTYTHTKIPDSLYCAGFFNLIVFYQIVVIVFCAVIIWESYDSFGKLDMFNLARIMIRIW